MADLTLTVFDVDDATALFEVGTASDHANPYLEEPENLVASEIDLLNGGGYIGGLTVRVIDPQAGATQAERWLTPRLGVPAGQTGEGHSQLKGHRTLLQTGAGGTIIDGTIAHIRLNDSYAGFTLTLKDIRERPRKVPVFTSAARRDAGGAIVGAPTVLPRGRMEGYGQLPMYRVLPTSLRNAYGWTIPPATPLTARVADISGVPALDLRPTEWPADWHESKNFPPELVATDAIRDVCSRLESEQEGNSYFNTFPDVRVLWRDPSSADQSWKEVEVAEWGIWSVIEWSNRTVAYRGSDEDGNAATIREEMPVISTVYLGSSGTLPDQGITVEFLLVYVGEPEATYPYTFEGTAGDFLADLYDGQMSEHDPRTRYDAAAVAAITTPIRVRQPEKRDTLRDVEEEVYRAIGYAPAVIDGLVTPVAAEYPPSGATLPEITDDSAKPVPGWEDDTSSAVTEVVLTYHRDFRVGASNDPLGRHSAGDGVGSRKVTHRVPAPDWAIDLVGDNPHEIDGWIFRALGGVEGSAIAGDVMDETGARVAVSRGHRILDRWLLGGQISAVRLRAADFPTIRVGDWVVDSRSWRPNYNTLQRGGPVLAQVMSLQPDGDAWLDLVLVDAGPNAQPLAAPTVGALSADSDGAVTVPITGVPTDASAEVRYAINDTEPAADSSLWTPGGRREGDGSIVLPQAPAGATVWVEARSVAIGRRPSDWTAAASVSITSTPRVTDVSATARDDGSVLFQWDPNVAAAGVRIHYEAHEPGATPTLPNSVDVDGSAGSHTLPAGTMALTQVLTADVEPWTGWDGMAVSGTVGRRVRVTVSREIVAAALAPTAEISIVSQTVGAATVLYEGSAAGEAHSEAVEYQRRIDTYSEDGTNLIGAWSAWAALPAQESVKRKPFRSRRVVMRARDAAGVESETDSVVVESFFDALGTDYSRGQREQDREGRPGVPGKRRNATDQLSDDGISILVDPASRRVGMDLGFPGGLPMDTGEDYAGRAGSGFNASGIIRLDVPLAHAGANLAALDTLDLGRIDPTEYVSGGVSLPVDTGDAVGVLSNGATVEDGAGRANTGFNASGIIRLDVPLAYAGANIDAVSTAELGRLNPVVPVVGGTAYPVDTADQVAALANGATVEGNASAGKTADDDLSAIATAGDLDRTAKRVLTAKRVEDEVGTETLESTRGARRKSYDGAGYAARGLVEAHRDREGQPGLPGLRATSQTPVTADGVTELVDPSTGRMSGLAFPGGLSATNGEDGATRARTGFNASGIVQLDVPLANAGANIDAVDPLNLGRLDPTQPTNTGTDYPVDTADNVSALSNGATVESGAGKANTGLNASGVVQLDVPLANAGANLDAVSTAESGRLDPVVPVVGGTAYPVDTADDVAALSNGATVESNASAGKQASDDLPGVENKAESKGQNLLTKQWGQRHDQPAATNSSLTILTETFDLDVMDLDPGAVVSFGAEYAQLGSTDANKGFMRVQFLDAGGATLATHDTPSTGSGSFVRVDSGEVVIPATATQARVQHRHTASPGAVISARRAMLSRGPVALPFEQPPFRSNRERLEETEGNLNKNVGANDGVNAKLLPKGATMVMCQNGQAVTFEESYQNTPIIIPGPGATMEQRSKWGTKATADDGTASGAAPTDQFIAQMFGAEASASGFTARLRLMAKGATTIRTQAFTTPTTGITEGNTSGPADPVDSELPAADDKYTSRSTLRLSNQSTGLEFNTAYATVALEMSTDGGTNYAEIGTNTVSVILGGGQTKDVGCNVTGTHTLTTAASGVRFRVRLKSVTGPDMTGTIFDAGHVEWGQATATYASATPGGDADAVPFFIIAQG